MSRGSALRRQWLDTGVQLGQRYAENAEAYAEAGYVSAGAYRRAFVALAWPNVGEHVKRAIREGFADGLARAKESAHA